MQNLRASMVDAHARQGEQALADLRAAALAPAPFTPEWSERAQAEYDAAIAGMRLWSL